MFRVKRFDSSAPGGFILVERRPMTWQREAFINAFSFAPESVKKESGRLKKCL